MRAVPPARDAKRNTAAASFHYALSAVLPRQALVSFFLLSNLSARRGLRRRAPHRATDPFLSFAVFKTDSCLHSRKQTVPSQNCSTIHLRHRKHIKSHHSRHPLSSSLLKTALFSLQLGHPADFEIKRFDLLCAEANLPKTRSHPHLQLWLAAICSLFAFIPASISPTLFPRRPQVSFLSPSSSCLASPTKK